jgi:hypothetical protein
MPHEVRAPIHAVRWDLAKIVPTAGKRVFLPGLHRTFTAPVLASARHSLPAGASTTAPASQGDET